MKPHYLRNRKLKFGVGINDANYPINPIVNGKRKMCHFYAVWNNMIRRCYMDDKDRRQVETPYIGCSVVEEWHKFSNFKSWMETQDWRDKQLDKDLKVHGNKIYGPKTCVFIPKEINTLISEGRHSSYQLKKGLTIDHGKIRARIRKYGKLYQIGNFDNEKDAHDAWVIERKKYIMEVAEKSESQIRQMLINWMECEFK
jgi:hypothetical protein